MVHVLFSSFKLSWMSVLISAHYKQKTSTFGCNCGGDSLCLYKDAKVSNVLYFPLKFIRHPSWKLQVNVARLKTA